ncbi:MAG: protein kinase, partial [Lachnospiraceae bacterium]|nr:protein kinase [Lachnospiraceae bacterium]
MDTAARLAVSYYKEIGVLDEEHKVFIVQHIESSHIYVKKVLDVYNESVFIKLRDKPVPGIPKIFDVVNMDGQLIIIEEYISGDTLEQRLANGALPAYEALSVTLSLCDIVEKLHSFNPPIIHRDIKPSNIILTSDGRVQLIDLNAAKTCTDDKDRDTRLLGTVGYAAPEQYGFGTSNVQTDIYAIGMLLNTML